MTLLHSYGLLLIAVALTGVAAVWDLRTGLIPNRLVALGAGLTVLLALGLALPGGLYGLGRACIAMVAGMLLVSLVPLLLYRFEGIGGGDVKLLAVVGAALGPAMGLEAELYAFAVVVFYAPARLLWQGKLLRTLGVSRRILTRPFMRVPAGTAAVPLEELTAFRFGPAIFTGTLAVAVLRWIEVSSR